MQISKRTIDILKNFASINENILIKGGTNKLVTMSLNGKAVIARAEVDETFPTDIAYYNLNKFLALLGKEDADVDFGEKAAIIKTKHGKDTVRYSNVALLKLPPDSFTKMDALEYVVEFELNKDQLSQLQSRANILGLSDVLITRDENTLVMRAVDKQKLESSDRSDINLGEYIGSANFTFFYNKENLPMMPDTYKVSIAQQGFMRLVSQTQSLIYNIAPEVDGTTYNA